MATWRVKLYHFFTPLLVSWGSRVSNMSYYKQNYRRPYISPHALSRTLRQRRLEVMSAQSSEPEPDTSLFGGLFGSLSSSGGYSDMSSSSGSCFSLDICPDIILALIAAAAAGGFYFIYITITMAGKRRRRRSLLECQCDQEGEEADHDEGESSWLSDILWLGNLLTFSKSIYMWKFLTMDRHNSKFAKLLNHCEWDCI